MPVIPPCTYDEFIRHLRNEWRVEFAFEDHRFWDIRRWLIGDQTQRELYGVRVVMNEDGTRSFHKHMYETRKWNDRMYLYPVPQGELYKNPNLNPQNQGW